MKKYFLLAGLLGLSMSSFAVTYDNATKLPPHKALMHDIIKVSINDVPKYCHFDRQIVPLPVKAGQTPYYYCVHTGEPRKTIK